MMPARSDDAKIAGATGLFGLAHSAFASRQAKAAAATALSGQRCR